MVPVVLCVNEIAYLMALNALLKSLRAPWHFEPFASVAAAEESLRVEAWAIAQDAYVEAYMAVYDVEPFHPYPPNAAALWEAIEALPVS